MVPPVQLAASSATSSLFSGVAPTTQLISFSCESPRQSMAARKASIPRVGSHNDIVQGASSQLNRDSIMMEEEEMKEPVSTFLHLSCPNFFLFHSSRFAPFWMSGILTLCNAFRVDDEVENVSKCRHTESRTVQGWPR